MGLVLPCIQHALATTVHGNELIKFREIFEGTYPHFNKEFGDGVQ